jgi:V8-like Glu-specific endopeptidase
VLTAGHCLFDPVRDAFFRDFAFVPAFDGRRATQPFGQWTTSFRIVTSSWADGDNTFPNRADFGVLVARDRAFGGRPRRLGEVAGSLGTTTFALLGNHISALGYPVNLDRGLRMQVTTGEVVPVGPLVGVVGSAMQGGSSGGPWVQDFGAPADGQDVTSSGPNRVVGVTSFGPLDRARQFIGSSVLNAEFVRIRARACGQAPGNC